MSDNKNQSNNRKSDLLSKEVEHIDITSFDARKIVSSMEKMSFVSRETENAANISVSYTHLTLPTMWYV